MLEQVLKLRAQECATFTSLGFFQLLSAVWRKINSLSKKVQNPDFWVIFLPKDMQISLKWGDIFKIGFLHIHRLELSYLVDYDL